MRTTFAAGLLFALAVRPVSGQSMTISLAGSWAFRLDPSRAGAQQRWFEQPLATHDVIFLPGTTDQAGYGAKTTGPEKDRLSRPYVYVGPAWYQRAVMIPESWRHKRITLLLERAHWQTEVWVDGKPFGMRDSLSTPHVYDLSPALAPGRHLITLCVDNTVKIDVGIRAHSVTDWTQTNWNGVVGRIELNASDPIYIDSAQVFPDGKSARIEVMVGNSTGQPATGELRASAPGGGGLLSVAKFGITGTEERVKLTLPLGETVRLWDEYQPELYTLDLSLSARSGALQARDQHRLSFGMRTIGARGRQFVLNGRPVFLRGTLECASFPKTGHPPTDVESWMRLFWIARTYGMNHFRFHSWCPPEAAFEAADQTGFLLQVELPVWSSRVGRDPALSEFMRVEGQRILKTYGNHPSFTMLCLGNELDGDWQFMDKLLAEFKAADSRRLYTFSVDINRRAAGPVADYYVTNATKGGRLRLYGTRFNKTASGTDFDFSPSVKEIQVPLVAHELGQWATYPDFSEIAEYTGVLKPRNLEVFRDQLAERGMLDQNQEFQLASGRFAWIVYKEDLESCYRTPNFGGFQLLQLQDFPGQGEALVGLLDSLWRSKGILTPEEFRRFSSETVPLVRMSKFVWTSDETFTGAAQVAHYGRKPLAGAAGRWVIRDESGSEWASGRFPPASIPLGSVTSLGEIRMPLSKAARATRLRITLSIQGTAARNDWDIWVYPQPAPAAVPGPGVLVTPALDAAAMKKLEDGGKVLLLWPRDRPSGSLLDSQFLPVFWSLTFFPKQAGTMGILCDPGHPALAEFPTDMFSNWQWFELMQPSRAFILDDTPPGYRPIVQVIDDFHRNHKLGAVFETRVGPGSLLVCSLDLDSNLSERPVARQLRYSLMKYVNSAAFDPKSQLPASVLAKLLQPPASVAVR
jgi:hypothetical protein